MNENQQAEDLFGSVFKELFGEDYKRFVPSEELASKNLLELLGLDDFEKDLGLPSGFLMDLLEDDDWSFVIKLHALFEAAVSHLLIERLAEPSLEPVISRLEMRRKLVFASALEVVDRETGAFLQRFSELRNSFVHNVTKTNATLESHFSGLNARTLKDLRKGLLFGYKPGRKFRLKVGENRYDKAALLKSFNAVAFDYSPKLSIWFGSLHCLNKVYHRVELARLEAELRDFDKTLIEVLSEVVLKKLREIDEEDSSENSDIGA
jgi:hypothetical protein